MSGKPKTPPFLIHSIRSARLWMMPAPSFLRGLGNTIKYCADLEIRHLLSTVEPHEVSALELEGLSAACSANDIKLLNFPMVDRQPPQSLEAFLRMSSDLHRHLVNGESVGIHCKSGIGRSGMHICALLGKLGFGFEEALRLIEIRRGLAAPNTSEQLDWLKQNWKKISVHSRPAS